MRFAIFLDSKIATTHIRYAYVVHDKHIA